MRLDEGETLKITDLQLLWREWPKYLYLSGRGCTSGAMPCKLKDQVQQRVALGNRM